MTTKVVFVRDGEAEWHSTWITRGDGQTFGVRLHVRHDLPHLIVESALGVEDGLWAGLAYDGKYVGLTPGHLAAKHFEHAIHDQFGAGDGSALGVRARLAGTSGRSAPLVLQRLPSIEDTTLELAIRAVRGALSRWAAVPPGEALSLEWPLSSADLEDLALAAAPH